MCGALRFEAEIGDTFSACHCKMCQRWSSGVYMAVKSTAFEVTQGADQLNVVKTSDWAERAFCSACGSNIYYHMPSHSAPYVSFGALDDTDGLTLGLQVFHDKKAAGFSFAEQTECMTEAQIMASASGGAD